ncbi:protein kinase [Nocardia sp. NPDC051030]|uniref:serine/threonine-protein kinase n=1 Tax=Nocardia sp. NPDC051030 TaxID=3155162 RepID=UPI0034251E40
MGLEPGAVFAGFAIERLLGAGGMGSVYLAGHPRLQRRVALKVLAETFTVDPKTRAAFDREATLAATLEHPNIVPVYDRSAADDVSLWLAMRYIDGGDAAVLLNDHPSGLAPQRAVRLVADAAHALDYAHAQGVLHRDVKPANLLIENNRRTGEHAVLTDFGIARTLDDTVTLSGIAATFAYAAPERFSDVPADHRADIYSLGCTLFQLLTGQPPFARKDQAAVIGAHLTAPPPSPRALRPDLPAELDEVIATALAKSPQDRYPSCTALAEAAARTLPPAVIIRPEATRPVVVSVGKMPRRTAGPTVIRDAVPPGDTPVPGDPAAPTVIREPVPPGDVAAQHDPAGPIIVREPVPSVDVAVLDEAAVPTAVRASVAPVPRLTLPPERIPEPAVEAGDSSRRRRFAVASGLFLTGVGVVVGAAFAMRGNSESSGTSSGPVSSSASVSQQVTPTTTRAPSSVPPTSAPPSSEAPPPVETPPPVIYEPPAQQSLPTVPATRQSNPTAEAPVIVPQTRTHQWPGADQN